MVRARHARAVALLVAWVIGLVLGPAIVPSQSHAMHLQDDPATVIEAGSGPIGEQTTRLVGRSVTDGETMLLTGYLTAAVGLDAAALFTDVSASVEAARFTFQGEIAVDSSVGRADVTETTGSGIVRVFYNEAGGAAWDDPDTFAGGSLVAEYTVDLSESLQRQAPGVGVVVGVGQLTQTTVGEFAVAGTPYRFGVSGIEQRLRYVGAQAGDETPLTVDFTGTTTVTQRESRSVALGSPGAAATPAADLDACAAVDAWFLATRSGLDAALALDAGPVTDEQAAGLDVAALREAATAAADLAATQLEVAVPDSATDAHRLAVTAISTYARGLQAMADAAEAQDETLFEQGRATVRDGESLLARASEAASTVADACAGATPAAEQGA